MADRLCHYCDGCIGSYTGKDQGHRRKQEQKYRGRTVLKLKACQLLKLKFKGLKQLLGGVLHLGRLVCGSPSSCTLTECVKAYHIDTHFGSRHGPNVALLYGASVDDGWQCVWCLVVMCLRKP